MFNPFGNLDPDETLSRWLENTFDQLTVLYKSNLYVLTLDNNNEGVYSIDDAEAEAIRLKIIAISAKLLSYEFNKKEIIHSQTITQPVSSFLFDAMDFGYIMMDNFSKAYSFDDPNIQTSLLEDASILVSIISATAEYALENNL